MAGLPIERCTRATATAPAPGAHASGTAQRPHAAQRTAHALTSHSHEIRHIFDSHNVCYGKRTHSVHVVHENVMRNSDHDIVRRRDRNVTGCALQNATIRLISF